MTIADTYMTLEEVADYCKVRPATLHKWRHRGQAPRAAKIGRRLVFRRDEVEKWAAERFEAAAR